VAFLPQGLVEALLANEGMHVFCPNGLTVRVNFRDDDLAPGQMDALGIL